MTEAAVIVLGSVNADLVIRTPRLPAPGETVLGGEFFRAGGGKGANQAVAAARCALEPVAFIGAVGDDLFGREAIEQLQHENLDSRQLKVVADQPTGVALITVDESGENTISVAPGANASLLPQDVLAIDEDIFRDARVFLTCLESPVATVVAALRRARQAGLITILNPAPANTEILNEGILSLVDIITPNEGEAASLAAADVSSPEAVKRMAHRFRELGCGEVLLTRGPQGAWIITEEQLRPVAAHQVQAVDTTAAGDAFNGTLAVALAEDRPLVEACHWANAAAAIAVTRPGARPSLPTRKEIESVVNSR